MDESPTKKSLESFFEQVMSPTKTGHQSEIVRFNNNTLSYISPQTKKLHSNILKNSPANLFRHNNNTIWALQKNMLTNNDYMFDYGELMNNPKAAKNIWWYGKACCKNIWWYEKVCPRFEIKNTTVDHVW